MDTRRLDCVYYSNANTARGAVKITLLYIGWITMQFMLQSVTFTVNHAYVSCILHRNPIMVRL